MKKVFITISIMTLAIISNAQESPKSIVKTDTIALFKQWQGQMEQQMLKELPVTIIYFSINHSLMYIDGWQKGTVIMDGKKRIISEKTKIYQILNREIPKK